MMAQRQITELPTATTPDGSELLLVRQDVYDKKLDVNSLLAYLQSVLDDRYLNESLNLSDVDAVQTAFDNIKQVATESYGGVVELATVAEAIAGIDTTRAVTPKGLYEAILQNVPAASYTQAGKVELATPNETKTGTDGTRAVTPEGIKAILDDMFVGQVSFFAMSAAPEGWLVCNGSAVSRTTYAKLFSKVGTLYGAGNGSTTFNLPDIRGEFLRGVDLGRGVDSGRTQGTFQEHGLASHSHSGTTAGSGNHSHTGSTNTTGEHSHRAANTAGDDRVPDTGTTVGPSLGGPSEATRTTTDGWHSHSLSTNTTGWHSHIFTTGNTGGSETRPRNVAMLPCIKY